MAETLRPSFEEVCFGSRVPAELLPALRENDFFYGVRSSLIDNCAGAFRIARLPGAAMLYSRKSASTRVFLILCGEVQLGYSNVGVRHAGETLPSGRFTGEVSLMPGPQPRHQVTATCVGPTLLCWARAVDITALLGSAPQIAINVAHSLHARVADALTAIDELAIG